MTSHDEYTLLPWILIDPELLQEDPDHSAISAVARHIRKYCSVMMGELDHQHLVEQAHVNGNRSARLLLEAIQNAPQCIRGLSIEAPESLSFGRKALGAILAEPRRGTDAGPLPFRSWAHYGSDAYLRSEERELIEERQSRPYESFSRDRIWTEVLEPFTRTPVINIYDRYLFRNVFMHRGRLARSERVATSGLAWFLARLAERDNVSHLTSVSIRSEMIPATSGDIDALAATAEEFVRMWPSNIDLHLEFCSCRVPHDRFMFAHTAAGNIRVLEQSNSLLEKLDVPQHKAKDAVRITLKPHESDARVAVRDWQRAGERIELSVRSAAP